MKKAFTWKNITFYGAGADDVGSCDYLILLTETKDRFTPPKADFSDLPEKLRKRMPKVKSPKVIHVPIKDFGVPRFDGEFFARIVRGISDYHGEQTVDVCVACGAGEGRTGTILALLAYKLGVVKTDPVLFIRKVYSGSAVETQSQIDWLSGQIGARLHAGPVRQSLGVGGGGLGATFPTPSSRGQSSQPPAYGWRRFPDDDKD